MRLSISWNITTRKKSLTHYRLRKEDVAQQTEELTRWLQAHAQLDRQTVMDDAFGQDESKSIQRLIDDQLQSAVDAQAMKKEAATSLKEQEISKRKTIASLQQWSVEWSKHPSLHNLAEPRKEAIQVPLFKEIPDGTKTVKEKRDREYIGWMESPKRKRTPLKRKNPNTRR